MNGQTLVIVAIAVVICTAIFDQRANTRVRNELFDLLKRREQAERELLTLQQATFTQTLAAVSDATAKAVQSITYPEVTATVPNQLLTPVHEMPVLERDRPYDDSDPTDAVVPDAFIRPDAAMLGDDMAHPFGIPGLAVDPDRYEQPT